MRGNEKRGIDMENTASQADLILDHLKKGHTITQREAARLFGCFRLSARIYDLKDRGNDIRSTMVTKKNRNGSVTNFSRYYLKGHVRGEVR